MSENDHAQRIADALEQIAEAMQIDILARYGHPEFRAGQDSPLSRITDAMITAWLKTLEQHEGKSDDQT